MATHSSFDSIVIGGGTAGCLVAHDLVLKGHRVLLLEAGIDTPPERVPADIHDVFPASYSNPAYTWGAMPSLSMQQDQSASPTPFFQARVMGGGSSLMGMVALRGHPSDYDQWREMGAVGWSWQDVLPVFQSLETDVQGEERWHGRHGPISIMRRGPEVWPPFCQALSQTMQESGFGHVADMNAQFQDGYGTYPLSCTPDHRISSASAFLTTLLRQNPRLTIWGQTEAINLITQGDRCTGVRAKFENEIREIFAAQVIICAGAIHTPALLMRSGIGNVEMIEQAGFKVEHEIKAVGTQLQNHCIVYLGAYLKPKGRQSPDLRPHFHMGLRLSSPWVPNDTGDIAMTVLPKSSLHGMGTAIAALGVALYQPLGRGRVRIDTLGQPRPEFSYIEQPIDFDRLCWGFEQAYRMMLSSAVESLTEHVFAAGYSDKVRRFNRPSPTNSLISQIMLKSMDGPKALRNLIFDKIITSGESHQHQMGSKAWIEDCVRRLHFGMYHPTGTCRMGDPNSPLTVVDPQGRVKGMQGLWVADASVMPVIPRANTFLPTLMVARQITKSI